MNLDWIGFQVTLTNLRRKKNITLEKFAKMTGVTTNLIWRLENSEVPPSLKLLKRVCEVYALDYAMAKKAVHKHKINLLNKKYK